MKNVLFPLNDPSRTPPLPLIILAIVIIFLHFILRSNFIPILILKKCPKCIVLSLNFILNSILNENWVFYRISVQNRLNLPLYPLKFPPTPDILDL